jgi:tRNA-Thr(GGU) m(6)t(6)A37 methyltransferase TsaA
VGYIEIFREYEEGLKDIEGFSHIVVLWIFHESEGYNLLVKPLAYKGGLRGVFVTSHPDGPNHIGVTVVELLQRKGNMLRVRGVDMADGSPVVDIKPYGHKYCKRDIRLGWVEKAEKL